jgi:integrase
MPRYANLTNKNAVDSLRWEEGNPDQFMVKDPDRKGFYIRLSRGGTKTWMYQFRFEGKLERLPLGKYPGVKCAEAFDRYDRARNEVEAGRNPAQDRRAARQEEQERERLESLTVRSLFYDHYLPRYAKPRKRTWINDELYFRTRIEPAFGDRPADRVTPEDVERLIRPLETEHYTTARLTLATLRKLYNWAAEYASAANPGDGPLLDTLNPCRHYRLGTAPPPPMRTLKNAEIRAIWNRLGDSNSDRIIRLQLLTGCRVSEVAGMHESELDREAGEWILPPERSKNGRALVVPLTALMRQSIGVRSNDGGFVFPASSKSGHTTGTGVLQALKRHCSQLGIGGVGTHTLRKTFITQMAKLGVPREIRDRLTNHADPSVDARHYNAHDYLREKTEALTKWESVLLNIVSQPERTI